MQKFPNTMAIMLGFILFVSLLTFIIPKGEYKRVSDVGSDYVTVVPGSFEIIKNKSISVFSYFLAIPEGVIEAGELFVLILLLGGCFVVIEKTGALTEGVMYMT